MMAIIYHNNLIPIPNPSDNNLIYQKEERKGKWKEFKQNYQNVMMNSKR